MPTTTSAPKFRLLGVNDDASTCTLCGRTNLKRVAWLAPLDADGNEDGEAMAYGTDCAGNLLLGSKTAGNTKVVRTRGEALSLARRWLVAGHSPEAVAKGIWNRYGFQVEARGAVVRFYFGTERTEVAA